MLLFFFMLLCHKIIVTIFLIYKPLIFNFVCAFFNRSQIFCMFYQGVYYSHQPFSLSSLKFKPHSWQLFVLHPLFCSQIYFEFEDHLAIFYDKDRVDISIVQLHNRCLLSRLDKQWFTFCSLLNNHRLWSCMWEFMIVLKSFVIEWILDE